MGARIFIRRFDVETQDARFKSGLELGFRLADAGKHHFRRVATGRQNALELATGDDVEAAAEPRENVEHAQIRVCLHGVADKMVPAGESAIEAQIAFGQRRSRVHVSRRSDFGRDPA
jgi:hypothetical protein